MRKSTKSLFSDLYDLHLAGVALDTRIIVDDGDLAIHWPLLLLWDNSAGVVAAGTDQSFFDRSSRVC